MVAVGGTLRGDSAVTRRPPTVLAVVLTILTTLAAWITRATAAGTTTRVRSVVLDVAGLGLITAGAWSWSTIAGFIVAGASLLLLNWRDTG